MFRLLISLLSVPVTEHKLHEGRDLTAGPRLFSHHLKVGNSGRHRVGVQSAP